ncbi:AP endonuclease 1 [Mytilus galloprovincialis]|uniref:exodeoxyribonuclease III n=2 Tax=Mytilus galloprovincialis TaxID=29158 RepID=A0A8B6DEY8_MYTGA|nr:AP endonuclease 1 [Mytilus galloprovincialis]VDI18130.1 AP endonuclease 1 [Mytilus galloprovincialis]
MLFVNRNLLIPAFNRFISSAKLSIMPPKRKKAQADVVEATTKKTTEAEDEPTTKKTKIEKKSSTASTDLPDDVDTSFPTQINPDAKTKDGRKFTKTIVSWNVNGVRAWLKKDGIDYLQKYKPDIFCIQETKCSQEKLPASLKVPDYHSYFSSGDTEGYAGTALYSKEKPINVTYGMGIKKLDDEGRLITAEYDTFYLVGAYVPNSGKGLVRLKYRTKEWDVAFRDYMKGLDAKKPVIYCGDLNVAHQETDLKNPKTNRNKTPGFHDDERQGFTDLLAEGFFDSFRELYPNARECWSFWTYMMNARAKNVGWRLDYFVLSDRLKKDLCEHTIQQDVMGSDHCPIVLQMAL